MVRKVGKLQKGFFCLRLRCWKCASRDPEGAQIFKMAISQGECTVDIWKQNFIDNDLDTIIAGLGEKKEREGTLAYVCDNVSMK